LNDSNLGRTDLWTPEEEAFLLANRQDFSMGDLAQKLGKTRSAVAGKSRRLGIVTTKAHHSRMITRALVKAHESGKYANRARPQRPEGYIPIVTTYKRGEKAVPKHMVEPPVYILDGVGVKIGDIESHHCKWVVGEPSDFICCGQNRLPNSPYCENHHQIAYKPRKN